MTGAAKALIASLDAAALELAEAVVEPLAMLDVEAVNGKTLALVAFTEPAPDVLNGVVAEVVDGMTVVSAKPEYDLCVQALYDGMLDQVVSRCTLPEGVPVGTVA